MSEKPNIFEKFVPSHEMPNCPLCKKPIEVPPKDAAGALMVFRAHGRAALAHDGCRPEEDAEPPRQIQMGYCERCNSQIEFDDEVMVQSCAMGEKCEAWVR